MTVPKAKKATQQKERQQLIQEIKQQNPSITDKQLSKYNIDDLRKIKMATAPKAETEKLSQVEQFDRDVRTGKFSQQYDTFRQPRMKYGGKMKKKYQSKGKVESQRDKDMALAFRLAKLESESSGRAVSDQDLNYALARIGHGTGAQKKARIEKIMKKISQLQSRGAAGKLPERTMRKQYVGEHTIIPEFPREKTFQYGGIADMSAAPMIKQPQQKKRKASGFRTKYSKGGGVRSSKYKL